MTVLSRPRCMITTEILISQSLGIFFYFKNELDPYKVLFFFSLENVKYENWFWCWLEVKK